MLLCVAQGSPLPDQQAKSRFASAQGGWASRGGLGPIGAGPFSPHFMPTHALLPAGSRNAAGDRAGGRVGVDLPSTTKSTEAKPATESTVEAKPRSEATMEGEGARAEATMEGKTTTEAKPRSEATMEGEGARSEATMEGKTTTEAKLASETAMEAEATSAKAAPAEADGGKAVIARVHDTEGAAAGKGRRSQRRTGCRNRHGGQTDCYPAHHDAHSKL
jgi:hypothetical protein